MSLLLVWVLAGGSVSTDSGGAEPTGSGARFLSLKGRAVAARLGPGRQYPVVWVYGRSGMPVRVLERFDQWCHIEDCIREKSWVLETSLSKRRSVIVLPAACRHLRGYGQKLEPEVGSAAAARVVVPLHRGEKSQGVLGFVECSVVADLISCGSRRCKIVANGYKGWVNREDVWGPPEDE